MSQPAASSASPAINPRLGLLHIAIHHLVPLFEGGPVDGQLASLMAHSAVEAYVPQSRADCVNAARVVAFSMAALALLGRVAAEPADLSEQLRAYGRATALNRSADQAERTMLLRRRVRGVKPTAKQPMKQPEQPSRDPEADVTEIEAVVAEAVQHGRAAAAAAEAGAATAGVGQPRGDAPARAAAAPGSGERPDGGVAAGGRHDGYRGAEARVEAALEAAVRAGLAGVEQVPGARASQREELLRHSALPRVVSQSPTVRTG